MTIGSIAFWTAVVLAFALPVLYFAMKGKALFPLSFSEVMKSLNRAFLVQLALAGICFFVIWYLEKNYYTDGLGNDITDAVMEFSLVYSIIGLLVYVPVLVLLNIVYLMRKALGRRKCS
jgi:hypothetical protein